MTSRPGRLPDWLPFTLDCLQPGYQYHRWEGYIRGLGRRRLAEFLNDDRMTCVDVTLADGDQARLPKAWLFAMQLHPHKSDVKFDDDDEFEFAATVEWLHANGMPFKQCGYCGMPIPYSVEQHAVVGFRGVLVEWWNMVRWYFDNSRLKEHESDCVRDLARVPSCYTPAPPAAKPTAIRDPRGKGSLSPSWNNPYRTRVHH